MAKMEKAVGSEKKTLNVLGYNGDKKMVAPGVWAYDAEAIVERADESIVYVHMNEYDGMQHYTVSEESLYSFDVEEPDEVEYDDEGEPVNVPFAGDPDFEEQMNAFCAGAEVSDAVEYIEEYDNLTDAMQSAYGKVFGVLNEMTGLMAE